MYYEGNKPMEDDSLQETKYDPSIINKTMSKKDGR
jgi:hypothetical protein